MINNSVIRRIACYIKRPCVLFEKKIAPSFSTECRGRVIAQSPTCACLIWGKNVRTKREPFLPNLFEGADTPHGMLAPTRSRRRSKGQDGCSASASGRVRITRLCRAHEVLAAKMRIEQRWSSIIKSFPAPGAPSRPGALCPEEVTK